MLIELTKVLEQDDKVIRQEAHLEMQDMRVSGRKVPARGAGDTCV